MATPAVRHPVGDPPAGWITTRKPCAEVLNRGRRSYYVSAGNQFDLPFGPLRLGPGFSAAEQ